jgi:hypothetical protein
MVSKFDFKFINLCRYAEENLPILFLVIDNGRAINTFTKAGGCTAVACS